MTVHYDPDEIAKMFDIPREHVIQVCVEESVPVHHGMIDSDLFGRVHHRRVNGIPHVVKPWPPVREVSPAAAAA